MNTKRLFSSFRPAREYEKSRKTHAETAIVVEMYRDARSPNNTHRIECVTKNTDRDNDYFVYKWQSFSRSGDSNENIYAGHCHVVFVQLNLVCKEISLLVRSVNARSRCVVKPKTSKVTRQRYETNPRAVGGQTTVRTADSRVLIELIPSTSVCSSRTCRVSRKRFASSTRRTTSRYSTCSRCSSTRRWTRSATGCKRRACSCPTRKRTRRTRWTRWVRWNTRPAIGRTESRWATDHTYRNYVVDWFQADKPSRRRAHILYASYVSENTRLIHLNEIS